MPQILLSSILSGFTCSFNSTQKSVEIEGMTTEIVRLAVIERMGKRLVTTLRSLLILTQKATSVHWNLAVSRYVVGRTLIDCHLCVLNSDLAERFELINESIYKHFKLV